jgi:predicted Fe-Mo cluster-binding NifX family protein
MSESNNTIAFVTDDGTTISSHFGRALYYEVITLQGGKVTERRRVEKAGHHSFAARTPDGRTHEPSHDQKHAVMTAPLDGVQVLVARGMGVGAQQHLLASGIQPVLTDLHSIDDAVEHFIAGTLTHNPRRLHDHGTHTH